MWGARWLRTKTPEPWSQSPHPGPQDRGVGALSVLTSLQGTSAPPPAAQRPVQARDRGPRAGCHRPQLVSQPGHGAGTAGPRWKGGLAHGGSALGHRVSSPPHPRSLQAASPLLRLTTGSEGWGWEGPLGLGSCESLLAPCGRPGRTPGLRAAEVRGDASPPRLRGSLQGQQAWEDWGRFNQAAACFCGWRCSLWGAPRSRHAS